MNYDAYPNMITKPEKVDHNAIILRIIKPHKSLANDTINQHEIADEYMLRRGEAITARRVRRIINELIDNGEPIISTPHNPGGYCWYGNESEAKECINRLRKKAAKIFIRARKLRRNCLAEKARQVKQEQMALPYSLTGLVR